MAVADRADTVEERSALRPARRVELARADRLGVIAGVAAIFVASIGMVEDFQTRLLVDEQALG